MNNLKKIGLTALGTALVATSASAADFSISGSTSITYAGHGTGVQGNNWGMGDSITFKTSGEMDNGLTISYQYEIDNGATGAKLVTIGTDGMGTLQFAGMDNSGPISAWDDITPNANEESWGTATGATATAVANGAGSGEVFVYDYTVMDGLALKASYVPSDAATRVDSSLEYGLAYTGIAGLSLYAATGENNNAANEFDNSMFGVKYTMGGMSVGYQVNETDGGTASTDRDATMVGISYAVSDDMSVSLNSSVIDFEDSTKDDQEFNSFSVSFTSGGLTIAASHGQGDNIGGTSTADHSGSEVNFKFAY
ncbi:porin [Pelagibacterales bacterium SAG-MED23]|nr:porin [Pelagibacterales bacterium SAG-MED23]